MADGVADEGRGQSPEWSPVPVGQLRCPGGVTQTEHTVSVEVRFRDGGIIIPAGHDWREHVAVVLTDVLWDWCQYLEETDVIWEEEDDPASVGLDQIGRPSWVAQTAQPAWDGVWHAQYVFGATGSTDGLPVEIMRTDEPDRTCPWLAEIGATEVLVAGVRLTPQEARTLGSLLCEVEETSGAWDSPT